LVLSEWQQKYKKDGRIHIPPANNIARDSKKYSFRIKVIF